MTRSEVIHKEDRRLVKTLDDSGNARHWDVFRKRDSANTKMYWL